MDDELKENDPEFGELDFDFDEPIDSRIAWWEQMVDRLISTSGQLSLA